MKVLFVASSNSENFAISPIIMNQGASLAKEGIEIEYFGIKGKGLYGYLHNIYKLRKIILTEKFDIIHAHYAFSGWVTFLTFTSKPIIVSYMGSDAYGDVDKDGKKTFAGYIEMLTSKVLQYFVKKIIAKSENIAKYINQKNKVVILPNGVNIEKFNYYPEENFKIKLGLEGGEKHILFIANEQDPRKNADLLYQAFNILPFSGCKIVNPFPVEHDKVVEYLNACDVVVLTSFLEGSPNVIKEAMACNCPIVSTDVGDVRQILDGVDGCYICSFEPLDVSEKISKALAFNGRTNGRQKLIEMGLDEKSVALKLISIYTEIAK